MDELKNSDAIQLFEDKKIRTAWDEEQEEWYFSIVDVIAVLTGTENPRRYWSDLKRKLKKEGAVELYEKIVQLKMLSSDGKKYKTDVANTEQLLRIIQSIPSPKAEPFKIWMAQVASERLDEMQDPELAIDRAMEYYLRKGYGEKWIEQRMQGKQTRKALTDEWKRCGVKDQQYATLTDIITKEWSGFTTREYKNFKGLHTENLRDHMTNLETAVNTLAEAFTTELSRKRNPKGLDQNKKVAKDGGLVAKETRQRMEKELGRSIISSSNAMSLQSPEKPKEIDDK